MHENESKSNRRAKPSSNPLQISQLKTSLPLNSHSLLLHHHIIIFIFFFNSTLQTNHYSLSISSSFSLLLRWPTTRQLFDLTFHVSSSNGLPPSSSFILNCPLSSILTHVNKTNTKIKFKKMQELQPINDVVNGGVLLRRTNFAVQPPPHQQQQQLPPQQTALKCPRCDSLNTKFCYYNNYNLSQPRHFCKNCRRYWTKGGVLRNVPVGGGCRKSKRTSSSTSKSKQPSCNGKKNVQSSVSSSSETSVVDGGLVQVPDVDNAVDGNGDSNGGLFSDDIGGLINLITNNSNNNNEVSISEGGKETTSFSEFLQNQEWEMGKIICGVQEEKKAMMAVDDIGDPTVRIEDFLQNRGGNNNNSVNVGLSTLDWNLTAENNRQGLFDITDDNHTVDHHDYWGQSTSAVHHHHDPQWSDSTTTHFPLFLP